MNDCCSIAVEEARAKMLAERIRALVLELNDAIRLATLSHGLETKLTVISYQDKVISYQEMTVPERPWLEVEVYKAVIQKVIV